MRPNDEAVDRNKVTIEGMPHDLYHNSETRKDARRRHLASQPRHSPFLLIQHLNQERSQPNCAQAHDKLQLQPADGRPH